MGKDRATDHDSNFSQDVPAVSEAKGSKQKGKSKGKTNKGTRQKKPFRQQWRSSSSLEKLELIGVVLGAVGGIGYLFAYITVSIWQNSTAKQANRPHVIVSRPPELLGSITCNITDKSMRLSAGAMRIWVKNIGKGDAVNAFVPGAQLKLVPEKKTGFPLLDDVPSVTYESCSTKISSNAKMTPVYSGQEVTIQVGEVVEMVSLIKTKDIDIALGGPQTEPVTPPGEDPTPIQIAKDAMFQLYAPVCVYYFARDGAQYGSCVTYRLSVSGPFPNERYPFSCLESPLKGQFVATVGNYCDY